MSKEKTVTAVEKINLLIALEIVKQLQGESVKEALDILDSARSMVLEHGVISGSIKELSDSIRNLQVSDEPGKLGNDQD